MVETVELTTALGRCKILFCWIPLSILIFLYRYMIQGDDGEWDQVLKKAGHTAIVSIKR